MHNVVRALAHLLAPWQSMYSNSKAVSGSVTFVHLSGLLFGGGFAVASDRAAFRAVRATPETRRQLLNDLATVHRPVLFGLSALAVSGILQVAADIETFAGSPVFWTKVGLIMLLVANGYRLMRTERALRARGGIDIGDPLWQRLRAAAVASVVLWSSLVLAGTTLTTIS
jgi:hypothetical protein